MNSIAIIPARGGSKGVKNKNIRLVDGKPLIVYTIETALQSKRLSKVIVDTDSDSIAEIARNAGAEVLIRPAELAQDYSSIVQVVERVLEIYRLKGITYDIVVLLQPTSPIKTSVNIDEAIDLIFSDEQTEAVISVVAMEDTHPARMYSINSNDKIMTALQPELESKRRQDLEPVFYRNGCIYVIKTLVFLEQRTFMPKIKKGYVMPSEWLANIDDERDLIITEALIKAWKEGRI